MPDCSVVFPLALSIARTTLCLFGLAATIAVDRFGGLAWLARLPGRIGPV